MRLQRGSKLDSDERIVLEAVHRGEIVRSIFADDNVSLIPVFWGYTDGQQSGAIFTAGEDGRVAVFTLAAATSALMEQPKTSKSKGGLQGRYKPY